MESTPGQSKTAAATAARRRKRQARLAAELQSAGWTVYPPGQVACPACNSDQVLLPEVHQDVETRAVYVRLDGRAAVPIGNTQEVAPGVNLDYDTDGKLVGVEIL